MARKISFFSQKKFKEGRAIRILDFFFLNSYQCGEDYILSTNSQGG